MYVCPYMYMCVYVCACIQAYINMYTCIHEHESESEVAQSWLTLCDPMDCSLPGSSVHGIFQARILEWIAISFSRGSSWPRGRAQVSLIACRRFTLWATREAHIETYLGDIVRQIPDHCRKCEYYSKMSQFFGFPVHIKIMFTLYCSLLSVQ